MPKHRISYRNIYVASALLALAVTVVVNLCILLSMAYGDYISGIKYTEQQEIMEHHVAPPDNNPPPQKPGMLPHCFWLELGIKFVETYLLFLVSLKILFAKRMQQWQKNTIVLLITILCILAFAVQFLLMRQGDMTHHHGMRHAITGMLTVSAFNGTFVYFSSLLYFYVNRWHDTTLENEALRAANLTTEYEALKAKLDPHFLFNALNTLSGLVAINSDSTEKYIQKLSTIFRMTLNHEDVIKVSDELKFAQAYDDLMTIRYDKALHVEYSVASTMMDCRIVAFGIQTLLENAVKHNTITARQPMHVLVSSEDGCIVVSNTRHPKREVEAGNGMGLKLLSKRCSAIMGHDIEIEETENMFTVKIPVL